MRAARVTVVVLCVCVCMCVYVCMCVCVCVHSYLPPHTGITKERYQRVHSDTGIILNFADFPKNASFKGYGVICLPRATPASYCFFPHEISFYASVKPIATLSLHRPLMGLWKTACDSLAQTRETAQIYGSRILIAPPTSAYTQYK